MKLPPMIVVASFSAAAISGWVTLGTVVRHEQSGRGVAAASRA